MPGYLGELGVRHRGIPAADELVEVLREHRPREIDALQDAVDGVADLGHVQAASAVVRPARRPRLGAHPDHPLGVVAVRASLEERERAVREARHTHERRLRDLVELSQMRRRRRKCLAGALEERELAVCRNDRRSRRGRWRRHRIGLAAVDAEQHRRRSALHLERGIGSAVSRILPQTETIQDPPDRRLVARVPRVSDRPGHEQPLLRARHGDVVEAEPLCLLGALAVGPDVLVRGGGHARPGRGMRDLEAEAPVRQCEDVGRGRAVAPCVGDHHHLELEPLRGVDRQQADSVRPFLLGDRVGLLRSDRLLAFDEPDEALDVGAAELLVRACEPRQLAQVRVAPAAVRQREDREVVVVLGEDALAQELERRVRGDVEEPLVALPEREQEPSVVLREVARQRALEAAKHRLPLRLCTDEDERIVGDADEGRRQDGEERLVVVAIVQQPQVGQQVRDLLLAEVVPPGGAIGRQPDRAELLLEPLGVGARGEEQHDLTRRGCAGVHQLADPPGDVPRLRPAPVHSRLAGRRLVRHEQLECVPQRRGVGAVRGLEPLELVAELAAEELVHGRQHLGPGAMVPRQRQDGRGGPPPLTEDGDVGVAEPVDRLELVTDDEQVGIRALAQKVEELGLQAVRVLELVDHDRAKSPALPRSDRLVVPKQVAGLELEVLEVDCRLALLGVRIRGRKRRQELLEEPAIARGKLLQRSRDDRVARLRKADSPRPARLQVAKREQPLGQGGRLDELESSGRGGALRVRGRHVVAQRSTRLAQRLDPLRERRSRARLEHEIAPGAAQRRIHLDEHLPEPDGTVGGEQLPAVRLVGRAEPVERRREGLRLEHERLRLVQDTEGRIDACGERIRAEQATAEPVDRGHPGAVELEREIGAPVLDQRRADAGAQLSCGALRVRDHEQRVDVEAVVGHGAHEPLDEHRGLPGARPRRDEDAALRLDRGPLLVVRERLHARSFRQIRQRSHQCGHSPPWGSWRTSPARIRSTSPTAVPRAASTASSNASGSR